MNKSLIGATAETEHPSPLKKNNTVEEKTVIEGTSTTAEAIDKDVTDKLTAEIEQAATANRNKLVEIKKLSDKHWHQVKKNTDYLVAKKQWKQAEQQLTTAAQNLVKPAPAIKARQTLLAVEDKALSRLKIKESIARGKWLSREYALQLTLKNSTQGSFLTPFTIQQLESKQHKLATSLILHAEAALAEKKLDQVMQCYKALNLILIPERLKPQVAAIGKKLYQNKKNVIAHQQKAKTKQLKALTSDLDKSVKNGKLVEATQIIERLKKHKSLSNDIQIKIEAINSVLDYNADFLDEKADAFYREGKIELAQSIWEYLLKLNPADAEILLKLSRVEKVIKNVQELRDAGHNAVPPQPETTPQSKTPKSVNADSGTETPPLISPQPNPQTSNLKPTPQP
ncbi:MAG: hypothetical protein KUG82_10330 [Pseudomonadales bacterium]|nr:hypothetical protein [Pseudomonadales bacterium]